MIRLIHVNKYFNRKKSNEIHVINETSLELGDKGLVTFLGSSGCGKTTLLNAIGGLDKVDGGDIYIDDERIKKPGEISSLCKAVRFPRRSAKNGIYCIDLHGNTQYIVGPGLDFPAGMG